LEEYGKGSVVVANFRCKLIELPFCKLSRNPQLLQKILVR